MSEQTNYHILKKKLKMMSKSNIIFFAIEQLLKAEELQKELDELKSKDNK